jgi:hypothetical protein
MRKEAATIISACEQTLEAVRLNANAGLALQQAKTKLATATSNTNLLSKEERQRLTDLHTSATGFLSSLENHGAAGAAQGGLEALRRRAEQV